MAAKGLDMKFIDDIRHLKLIGFTKRRVARTLGIHRDTVTRYWSESELSLEPAAVTGLQAQPCDTWSSRVDWRKVRDEVLSGVSLSVIDEAKLDKIPVTYAAFWRQLQRRAP